MTLLYLCMEVAGCPTVCRHCWAQGTRYGAMPLDDVVQVLERSHRFCDARGVPFDAYPMHEVVAHPDAARLFRLFNEHSATAPASGGTMFEPLPTTGVPLATRDDWREVLGAAADAGASTLWLAFHGMEEEHDRQVGRRGAFAESCLAARRIHDAGLRAGCNVFLTADNLHQVDELAETLRGLPIEADVSWEVAGFLPTARSRRNERLRPALADLLPVADRILALASPSRRSPWTDLEGHTEAAFVRRAAAGDWPAVNHPNEIALVCRPDLDVYSGLAGLHRTWFGNLRTDGVDAVLERALAHGHRADDALWFPDLDPLPSPAELAARHGDPADLRVHPGAESVRYLWLDRARRLSSASASRRPGTTARASGTGGAPSGR